MVTRLADRAATRALALAGRALTAAGLAVLRAGGRLSGRAIERADPAIRRARMLREARAVAFQAGPGPAPDLASTKDRIHHEFARRAVKGIQRDALDLTSRTPPDGE